MSNGVTTKKVAEKTQNEDSSVLSNSTNTSFSENILQDINYLKSKDIYLISKNFENKIPEILTYLQNDSNTIANKMLILKYLETLFSKVIFNSEIFLYKFSNDKERLNLFQVIINQFVISPNDREDYLLELKNLFTLLLSQVTVDKDTYHYIFSFLINYINKCNNNRVANDNIIQDNNNSNFTGEQLSKVLQLLQIYYQSVQTIDEPYNYFFFINGESDSSINITNIDNPKTNKKLLDLKDSLNIIMFIKLLPSQVIKQVYPIINFKILDIFFSKNKNISIGIDKDNYLITNFTSDKLKQLQDSKMISILVKLSLKDNLKTEIFVNNEKVEISKDIIKQDKDKKNISKELEIKKIKFFETFIGICSNIIIYKESEKDKKMEGLPKFFTVQQTGWKGDVKDKYILKQIYLNGFYKEELFSVFTKQQLKEEIDETILKQLNFPIKDKSGENDIKDFLEKNLISIYMPNRIMLPEDQINKSYKNANRIILKDSINNLDAEFNTNSPYINGVHLFTKFSDDFCHFGGLNHFLPIIEIMTQNEDLLFNENLSNFINLISSLFMPSYLNSLKNENNSKFFFNLSLFLGKITDIYFDNRIASKLISISSFLIYLDRNYINLIQDFHNFILMNENILFKFNYEDQALLLEQIKFFIDCSQREGFSIDIMLIINILLHYDKEKYNKFCCKNHSEYFNEQCEVLSPELHVLLRPIEEIITKLFEKFVKEASQCKTRECETGPQLFKIFEMLTIDISPCLQKIIINQFFNYMKKHYGKYFAFLDKERQMLDITLFIFKTSIFDVKIDALNLLLFMNKVQENMEEFYSNRSRTNSWAFKNETNVIDKEKAILIQNYILPFYLLGEGILVSSSSNNNTDNNDNTINIENDKVLKKTYSNKNLKPYKIPKTIITKLKKNPTINPNYNLDIDDNNRTMSVIGKKNNFKICQNGRQFNYIKITTTEQKIYLNYKKEKINDLINGLYDNIFNSFKEKIGFDFIMSLLVKIVSKGDILLILKFLDNLKKKFETKEKKELIYNNQLLFLWLLETSFQTYMIKESNFNEEKFLPGFCIDPIKEEEGESIHLLSEGEKKKKVDEIYNITNDFIIDILKQNIYKLDYIFTWSKYYYEMRNNVNNFDHIRDYLLKILRNAYKLPHEISLGDKVIFESNKESIYYLNLLFEFLTFYKLNAAEGDGIKKQSEIEEELSRNFQFILLLEINDENRLNENDIMKTLNIKWKAFPFYERIYSFFKPLWTVLLDKKKKDEKEKDSIHILKKYIGKKNSFINELELLFYSFNDNQELHESSLSKLYANKGIKPIIMIFNFFILLFNIGGNENEVKSIYNDFRLFITLLIISSTTLVITYDTKKQKWPNDIQYKEVQDYVKLILSYTLYYFVNKINEIDILIEKNKIIKNGEDNEKLIKYYFYLHQILIENLGYFLKLINSIDKENDGKFFSKKIIPSSNIKSSGTYYLSQKLYSNIGSKDSDSNKSDTKTDNFLDNILKISIKRDSKDINPEFKNNIYSFIRSDEINKFLYGQINDKNNINKLYSFGSYIQKREKLINTFIPTYDNRVNSYNTKKDFCLVTDFWEECNYTKVLDIKIGRINNNLIKEIFINHKKINLEENEKIIEYKKIKKKLFSFKGIWSKEEFFYDTRYHLKYKLVNHLTEEFSKVLLTPILDLDYYLLTFTYFKHENIFRYPEKLIPIYYLADLSFALKDSHKSFLNTNPEMEIPQEDINSNDKKNVEKESKDNNIDSNININETLKINENVQNEKNKTNNNNDINNIRRSKRLQKKRLNALFDVKIANYSFHNSQNSNNAIEQVLTDSILFSEFISKKHLTNSTKDAKVDACLVKTELHICGTFYNNSKEIGFYGSERNQSNEEGYDSDRKVCFGSVFKPQTNKYHYYYIKIPYSSIEFILKRRYLFKKTVLEIFTINKKSYSFRFEETQMKKIYDNIRHYMKSDIDDITIEYSKYDEKIGLFNKNQKLNKYIYLPYIIKNMNLKYLYDKWMKWEISTLKMIMILNLYGNRSYNDINQYPVFPWIVTDYSSNNLPAQIPIRPFGVPVGMLDISDESKERKQSFISSWEISENDEEKDEENRRYRTHYSNSLYVTYYLVRIFPFSSIRIELQGKSFDDPNRLFNSLSESFNCALTQKSDIRELIPEFFFLPEIFYNLNKLNLGNIKNRENNNEYPVNDVVIPNWANNDGYIFVNKHRIMLESTEVSEKINEWFNIIFGFKQKGKEAKKIGNLFMSQSYENFEEIYNKSEENEKIFFCRTVEFGVTPHQIFKYEAYKRMNYNELKFKRYLFPNITEIIKKNEEKNLEISKEIQVGNNNNKINKNSNLTPIKLYLYQKSELEEEKIKIYVLNKEGIIKTFKNESTSIGLKRRIISSKNLEYNINDEKVNLDKKITKKIPKNSDTKKNINLFLPKYRINNEEIPNVFFDKGHCIALGGFWNGNILIENINSLNIKEKTSYPETKIYSTGEFSPITHITIDEDEIFVVCGNILGTVFVYVINEKNKTIWFLYKVIYDNYSPISSIEINKILNIFITCSKDGYCMIYTLPKCKLVNSFKLKNIISQNNLNNNENISFYPNISIISSSPLPCIIFYFKSKNLLAVISINGHLITDQIIDFDIHPNGIKKFTDRQFVDYLIIFNPKTESIDVYNIIDLKIIMTWPIKNYIFIDFIFLNMLDNIFVLIKYNLSIEDEENDNDNINEYKILVLKNANNSKAALELDAIKSPLMESE